jgi:formylglycine-generating enzyme required for sulfatase activity
MMTSRVFVLRLLAGAAAAVVAQPLAARADDHRVAVNVSVIPPLKLSGSDLSRIVRGQLGRYGGVVALPEGKTKDAIAEERASTNSKCKSGVLDQKCQLSLGSALAASHWLEVTIARPGKSCEVSLEYLSIVRESSDAGDNVPAACDRDAVAAALRQGLETIANKQGWSGAGAARGSSGLGAVVEDPNDPVAQALKRAEAAKATAAADAEAKAREAADRVRGAETQWPTVRTLANDRSTPVEARLEALRAFSEKYPGTDRAREADALATSLEAEQARAAEAAAAARAAEEAKRAAEEAKRASSAEMVSVPAGEFFYGCNAQVDSECGDDEKPGRRMTLPEFRIDRTEVTVAAYRACVQAGRCSSSGVEMPFWNGKEQPEWAWACNWGKGRDDHPMNCVDWSQARALCAWKGKRLPTEQEWEKAARGTDGRKYAWGNEGYGARLVANIADETAKRSNPGWTVASGYDDGFTGTSPVGTFPAGRSPYGAVDMIGNVWEWCENDYSAGNKALRGGSWSSEPRYARASGRRGGDPGVRFGGGGFRCAQSAN